MVPALSLLFRSSLRVWGSWPSPEGHFPVGQSPPGRASNRNSCLLTGRCPVGPHGFSGSVSPSAGPCPPRNPQTTVTLPCEASVSSFVPGEERRHVGSVVFKLLGAATEHEAWRSCTFKSTLDPGLPREIRCGGAGVGSIPLLNEKTHWKNQVDDPFPIQSLLMMNILFC